MFDSFPVDKWGEEVAEFWTWGGGGSTGTWILTVLGFAFSMIALFAFAWLEQKKLQHQAGLLRAAGGLDAPPAPTTDATS